MRPNGACYAPEMVKAFRTFVAVAALTLWSSTSTPVQAEVPPEGQPLFVVERNKNANFVRYEAKLAGDAIDTKDPIIAYWIMAAEDGRRESLSAIERALAYGFSAQPDKKGNIWLTLVSHKTKAIRVFKDATGVHAEVGIAGKRAYLTKMFVQAGPEFIPKVIWLDLYGVDAKTGTPLHERIAPSP